MESQRVSQEPQPDLSDRVIDSRKSVDGDSNENSLMSDKPVRVYADGVFDMYHIGHAKVLE